MPGLSACARCNSRLELEGLDVEPPRASRLRAATQLTRAGNRLRLRLPDVRRLWRSLGIVTPEPVDWRALAWSFVPGLGHLKSGRPVLGRVFLSLWIVLAGLAFLSIGTWRAGYLLAGMVAVHAVAVVSLFAANVLYENFVVRAAFGLAVFLGIHYYVYRPAVWLGSRFCMVVRIGAVPRNGAIEQGDGLLCAGPWLRPEAFARGDLVIYQIGEFQLGPLVVLPGIGVDRVAGVPGDHIAWSDRELLVNGVPHPEGAGSIARMFTLEEFEVRLAPGEYAIFPTQLQSRGFGRYWLRNQVLSEYAIRHLGVIRHDVVFGRVLLRVQPFSRFGRIG